MALRPVLSSVTLVALLITVLFLGCAKEEPPLPTAEAPLRPAAPALAPAPAPSPSTGEVTAQQRFRQALQAFQNQDSHFEFASYGLRPDVWATLDRKVAFLNENSSIRT